MTKVKSTKPSEALLARRRAKETVTIPKDYAILDKHYFIQAVDHFPTWTAYFYAVVFYTRSLLTGKFTNEDRVQVVPKRK